MLLIYYLMKDLQNIITLGYTNVVSGNGNSGNK